MKLGGAFQGALEKHETPLTLLVFLGSYPIIYTVNILLTRALGPEDYGDYAVTRSVAMLTATFALLGLNKASLNFLPVYRKQGAKDTAKGFILASLLTVVVVGLLLSVIGVGITEMFMANLGSEAHPIRIAMAWVIPLSIGLYATSLLSGHQQVLLSSFLNQLLLPLVVALLVGGVLIIGTDLTDFGAVILLVLARVILFFIIGWLLWSIWRNEYREVKPTYEIKHWVGATVPFLLPAFVVAALGQSSMLILEAHHPTEDSVGIYAAVQQVAYLPLLALAAITTLAMPRLAVLMEENETETFHQQLGSYIRILTAFGVGSLLLYIFAGNFLLGLFGHTFSDGHMPLVVLGVGYLVVLIGGLIQPILQIRQEKTIVISTMLILLALNIGLTYLLAPKYGAMGAAVSYTVSVAVIYTVQLYLLQHNVGIPYLSAMIQRQGHQ